MPSILTRPAGVGGGGGATLEIGVYSDAGHTTPITSADFWATIYLLATPTGFTPTSYRFYSEDSSGNIELIQESASASASWVISQTGNIEIFGEASDDGENWIGFSVAFESSSVLLLDTYPLNNVFAISQVGLRTLFTDPLNRLRRSGDNDEADFSRDNSVVPVRITDISIASNAAPASHNGAPLSTFISGLDAFSPIIYDQTTNSINPFQATLANQPQVASSGSLLLGNSRPILKFDGTNDYYRIWTANTPAPSSIQSLDDSISFIAWIMPSTLPSGGAGWYGAASILEIGSWPVNGNVPICVSTEGTKLQVGVADNSVSSFDLFSSTANLATSTWVKIGVTINSNTIKMYINGILDSTHTIVNATGVRAMSTANAYGTIAAKGGATIGNNFNGSIITAAIFDSVLTDAEIADIHTNYFI